VALSGLLTKGKSFKSCAIVGNAGHLNNSAYGQYIDNHEAVLRFNVLPVGGFEVRPGIIHVNQARYQARQSGPVSSTSIRPGIIHVNQPTWVLYLISRLSVW
jgi:hypothetical protein